MTNSALERQLNDQACVNLVAHARGRGIQDDEKSFFIVVAVFYDAAREGVEAADEMTDQKTMMCSASAGTST